MCCWRVFFRAFIRIDFQAIGMHKPRALLKVVEQHFNECSPFGSTQMGLLAFTDQISYDYIHSTRALSPYVCYTEIDAYMKMKKIKKKPATICSMHTLTSSHLTFHHSIKLSCSMQCIQIPCTVCM